MPRVYAVNISENKGGLKRSLEKAFFIKNFGVEGDPHGGKGDRQVSMLAVECIEKIKKRGTKGLCTGKFAENITTEGIALHELSVGTVLTIGEVRMEVSQVGKKCYEGCEIRNDIERCPLPSEVIFTRVLTSGWIEPGNEIILEV